MLKDIYCEKFKDPHIKFLPGLNVVLGDENASNSTGKSTFLMIIDYIFGGDDYITKCLDVFKQENVGEHEIYFHFLFDKDYFFMRSTLDKNTVFICDENRIINNSYSIDEYKTFLHKKYKLNKFISFRNCVGRYSRIFGKDNLNYKRPLNVIHNEKSGQPVLSLLKLFDDRYQLIANDELDYKNKDSDLSVFKSAARKKFISLITKKQYENNEKIIFSNELKMKEILTSFNEKTDGIEKIISQELNILRNERTNLNLEISKLDFELKKISQNITNKKSELLFHRDELLSIFPNINISKLNNIESFHEILISNLKNELQEYKANITSKKLYYIEVYDNLTKKINELMPKEVKISNDEVLNIYAKYNAQNELLKKYNDNYLKSQKLIYAKDQASEKLNITKEKIISDIVSIINKQLEKINDLVTNDKKKPPRFGIYNNNEYFFEMISDGGAGSAFRGMIEFDIAIAQLTILPILIHDSYLYKNIEIEFMERIIDVYMTLNQQVFISIDELKRYKYLTQEVLKDRTIIKLGQETEALFGKTWNSK